MFKEIKLNTRVVKRLFSKDTNELTLSWHYDNEDRYIIILNDNDWKFQFDNKLPQTLNLNQSIFIKKNKIHRLIKGTTDLEIMIVKIIEKDDWFCYQEQKENQGCKNQCIYCKN